MSQAYGKQFSYVYNLLWGNFARQIAPKILDYFENTAVEKSKKSMLDLCCGAGHLSAFFLAHGYSVIGIDLFADIEENNRAWTRITGFIRNTDGKYDRFEETIFNTAFNLDEVKNLLISAGWRKVSLVSESNFYTPLDEPENYSRVFFISEK